MKTTTNTNAPATTTSTMIDITDMSDAELDALLTRANAERDAREINAIVTEINAPAAAPRTFDAALASFVDAVNEMRREYYAKNYSNLTADPITVTTRGIKYVKLVSCNSVYCFVRKSDGAILKAATYKTPAKHARGNINDANPLAAVTPHGAVYLV